MCNSCNTLDPPLSVVRLGHKCYYDIAPVPIQELFFQRSNVYIIWGNITALQSSKWRPPASEAVRVLYRASVRIRIGRVRQHSAESRGFSPGSLGSTQRESWQGVGGVNSYKEITREIVNIDSLIRLIGSFGTWCNTHWKASMRVRGIIYVMSLLNHTIRN